MLLIAQHSELGAKPEAFAVLRSYFLVILGGVMGDTILDEGGVKALAALPSLDELRAKIVGMISTPATRIAGVLQAPGGQVARVIGAYGSSEAA